VSNFKGVDRVDLESSVPALVATFRADDRARLAYLCYRKTHLRPIGLAIGPTCGLGVLVNELGQGLRRAIFVWPFGGSIGN
jgi:hypothetical protein